jgi:hypothetical protein
MLAEEFLTEWFEASHSARTSYIARVTTKKHLEASWWDKPAASLKSKDAYKLIDKISLKAPGAANNVIKYCMGKPSGLLKDQINRELNVLKTDTCTK